MAAHKSLRVLFADDERSLQEFMRSELPRLGHEVTVCPDSRTAVETLRKATFDAAILDLRMEHDKAGLQVGDVVTAIDGKTVSTSDDLTAIVATYQPGDKATLTVKRNGATKTLDIQFGQRPAYFDARPSRCSAAPDSVMSTTWPRISR